MCTDILMESQLYTCAMHTRCHSLKCQDLVIIQVFLFLVWACLGTHWYNCYEMEWFMMSCLIWSQTTFIQPSTDRPDYEQPFRISGWERSFPTLLLELLLSGNCASDLLHAKYVPRYWATALCHKGGAIGGAICPCSQLQRPGKAHKRARSLPINLAQFCSFPWIDFTSKGAGRKSLSCFWSAILDSPVKSYDLQRDLSPLNRALNMPGD